MSVRGGVRRGVSLAAVGLVAVLLAGGCGAGSPTSRGDSAAEAPAGAGQDQAAPGQAGAGAPDLRVDQRSIIYTGTMQVQVDDVERAARAAIDTVAAAGGFVGGDQRRSEAADARAELELRVPAAKFTAVIDELAKLGRQQRREVRTEDVTEEAIDLDARITSQRARVESARRLLARAGSISELISLEGELAKREADLASLEAKKRRLADLTALSTITVTFVGPDASTAEEETEIGFLVGLRGGWRVFVASLTVLVTVLGAVLPWLVAVGVPVVLLVRVLRRRRRRSAPPAGPAPVGPAGPPTAPPPVPAARSGP